MKEGIFLENIEAFYEKYEHSNLSLLLFIAEETNFNINDFDNLEANINGAIVPEVIFNNKNYSKGIIVCELDYKNDLFLVDLNSFKGNKVPFSDANSLMVLVDALSSNVNQFLKNLEKSVDMDTNIIGAGVGKKV